MIEEKEVKRKGPSIAWVVIIFIGIVIMFIGFFLILSYLTLIPFDIYTFCYSGIIVIGIAFVLFGLWLWSIAKS